MVVQASRRFRNLMGNDNSGGRHNHPQSNEQSHAVLDALSDENSKLARFLFIKRNAENNSSNSNNTIEEGDDAMRSMGDLSVAFLSLDLEPTHIRNERITQIFEAYAIFGALFMNGVWIIYEWGSSKGGYGGDGGMNYIVERLFESIMALALCFNTFFALFSAVFWILSLFWSTNHDGFAFYAGKAILSLN